MSIKYNVIDVFTKDRYAGNQLAIVEIPPSGLTQEQKQAIANEFHYSETTFVHPQEPGSLHTWTVDIFTPDQELPFAGHPTIGTAVHLLKPLAINDSTVSGFFNLKAGRVKLEYNAARQTAEADIPHNVHIHQELCSGAEMIKLQPKLGRVPSMSPVVSIVTGMTFVLAELDSQDTLTFVNPTSHTLQIELDDGKTESFIGCYFYYKMPEGDDGVIRLRTRMIESSVGEDAATGSAACTLACYLTIQQQRAGTTSRYLITQGVEMGRRSDIGVDVKTTADGMIDTVTLSGSAVQVMEGHLSL
jgi:PhzF family phenazine biosynthesis protein